MFACPPGKPGTICHKGTLQPPGARARLSEDDVDIDPCCTCKWVATSAPTTSCAHSMELNHRERGGPELIPIYAWIIDIGARLKRPDL
jgi:hypothetical protein